MINSGVKIYKNTIISSINVQDNCIKTIECTSSSLELSEFDRNTIYVNALSVESFADLIGQSKIIKLSQLGHQIQTQVMFEFEQNIPFTDELGTVLIHYDSPWFLMTRAEETFWNLRNKNISIWSVGIGMWDVPGYNKKCAIHCAPQEIAKECWRQMKQNKQLDLPEWNDDIQWNMWYSFQWDNKLKELTTWEPKWSNSSGTLKLRPHSKDEILNLYNATAYTLNDTITFNMEGAAESGRCVAKLICADSGIDAQIKLPTQTTPIWLKIIRYIDSIIHYINKLRFA